MGSWRKLIPALSVAFILFAPALFAGWVDADGYSQDGINVSQTTGSSYTPSLALDASDYPCVAWYEDGKGLMFVRWNGSVWVDADGSGRESDIVSGPYGYLPVVRLDQAGNPHIMFHNGSGICYLKWNGSAWVDAYGTGTESSQFITGNFTEFNFDLDNSGRPCMAYSILLGIYMLRWNGSAWTDIDGSGTEHQTVYAGDPTYHKPQIAVDTSGTVHLAWSNDEPDDVLYTKWNGATWVNVSGGSGVSNVSSTGGHSCYPSMDLDSGNLPGLAWVEDGMINYSKWTGGSWSPAGGGRALNNWANPCLVFDKTDRPHITYVFGGLKYRYNNGSGWVDADGAGLESETVYGSTSNMPSMAINVSGCAEIAWNYDTEIYFLQNDACVPPVTPTITPDYSPTQTHTPTWTMSQTATHTMTVTPTPTITQTPVIPPLVLTGKGNFPNPITDRTAIVYWLSVDAEISITIYTVSGEVVLKEKGLAGSGGYNSYLWDRKNRSEKPVASGVFIYTIEAVRGSERAKLTSKTACVK